MVTTTFNPISVSEIEIRYKSKVKPSERPSVRSSQDSYKILSPLFDDFMEHHEEMYALYTNRANKCLGCKLIGVGGVAGVAADPKVILQGALLLNAAGIVLAHNHPSGSLNPSQADIQLTRRVTECCKVFDMELLDHLILTTEGKYFSFADEGLM